MIAASEEASVDCRYNLANDNLGTAQPWRPALYLELISSTFSTIVSQLSASRIGRDAAVDWMFVAAIPARDWALSLEPSTSGIAIGIAFHQWADISWALVFFGVLGKWTARLSPASLAAAAVPWAILTSAVEWFVLVPLVPFWQPILPCSSLTGSAFWSIYPQRHVPFIRPASSFGV